MSDYDLSINQLLELISEASKAVGSPVEITLHRHHRISIKYEGFSGHPGPAHKVLTWLKKEVAKSKVCTNGDGV